MISPALGTLFAVHIADGVLPLPILVGGWLFFVVLSAAAWWKLDESAIPKLGLLSAALFVASQIHLPVGPGSVHLLLTGIAGILLGHRAIIAVGVAVTFQAMLFGHGGLTTIGVNGVVLGASAVIIGVLWPRVAQPTALWGAMAGGLACILSVTMYGSLVWLAIPDSRVVALTAMALHVPVLVIEAIGTGFIVAYLAKVKPDWLRMPTQPLSNSGREL